MVAFHTHELVSFLLPFPYCLYDPSQQVVRVIEQVSSGQVVRSSEAAQKVLALVRRQESGMSVDEISSFSGLERGEAVRMVDELVGMNELYQSRPGHYKAL